MNPPAISEPEPESNITITAALVGRVSDRMATGVPLGLALAGEPVSCAEYEEHLRQHPELAALQGVARRKFFQNMIEILIKAKEASANIRWLLERLYPDVLNRQPGINSVAVNVTTIGGMNEEELKAFREEASKF